MKTTFVLHGGFAAGIKQQSNAFFQEMLKGAPENVKVLLVYFAEADEKVSLRTQQDTEELNANRGSKQLEIKVATADMFEKDCTWADVIYLHGGKTIKLVESLSKYPNIRDLFSGKIVSGDSAGAHALGKLYYSRNSKIIRDGLGIVPLKIMAHYQEGTPDPFVGIKPELETLLLREYEVKVIYYS